MSNTEVADMETDIPDGKDVGKYDDSYQGKQEAFKVKEEDDEKTKIDQKIEIEDKGPPGEDNIKPEDLKLSRVEKSKLNNMTYEEQVEVKKGTSLGTILSGLSSGSLGNKAKENVVKVEEVPGGGRPRRNRWSEDFRVNKWEDSRWVGGPVGWGGGQPTGWGGGPAGWGSGPAGWGDPSSEWGVGPGNWVGGLQSGSIWNEENYEEQMEDDPSTSQSNQEWIAEEMKVLEQEYGEGVASIVDDEELGLIYFCEICQAQINARKSLDGHMNGMRHLKKKNFWEKKKKQKFFTDPAQILNVDKGKEKSEKPSKENDSYGTRKNDQEGGSDSRYQKNQGGPPPHAGGPPPQVGGPPPQVGGPPPQVGGPPPQAGGMPSMSQGYPSSGFGIPPHAISSTQLNQPEKPKVKSSLNGSPTGVLLKKLAACAVKSSKDSDLATNVVIALVKIMKEYNHEAGDTNAIEMLTEIDLKLQGLKKVMSPASTDTTSKKSQAPQSITTTYSTGVGQLGNSRVNLHSRGSKSTAVPNTSVPPPQTTSGAAYAATSSDYSLPPSSGQSSHAAYQTVSHSQSAVTDADGYSYGVPYSSSTDNSYYSQGTNSSTYGQVAPSGDVLNIIKSSAAPPPPPPPESGNAGYSGQVQTAQGYQSAYPGFFSQPPPGY